MSLNIPAGIKQKSVAFHTLGCKLNFAESSTLGASLESNGFRRVNFSEPADVYVINSCSVTESADRKCRKAIRSALRRSPEAFVAVTGCYAQLKPDEIASISGVDLVLGAGEKFNLSAYLDDLSKREKGEVHSCGVDSVDRFFSAFSTSERTRTFLKVQDGCDYTCSYCTIPMARGRSRSATVEQTVENARKLVDAGAKEIVLSGVNIGDFGAQHNESFLELLQVLDTVSAKRIRISSIEPNLLTNEIIDFISRSGSFVPHLHLPLQSGADTVLKRMRRRYSSSHYLSRVKQVKEIIPDCCIGVDVIVGFPGETDSEFMETYDLLLAADISYLHVFSYSERPGTDALLLGREVSCVVKSERNRELHLLSAKKLRSFYQSAIGQIRPMLVEYGEAGTVEGFTDNYIRVSVSGPENLVGTIQNVQLASMEDGLVRGTLAD
ncbi:MAG: tRNA (N(6)-L-threonylcarbamoyladenosine(37)-C(2))-methylthiotransferase MtaB [Candidatus Marinimicrobia bacterium]|nr:tRNA (N(6)-L-threonylcarbamoyladenosine(37)-C(2))-methylthiotransferase MtaB [Candidatus Neomarinimicrobiota bacterium]|tara:strand:+ start:1933 stop:3246 length:1314 start_codon:yes stop_codon:yes gene_type:complete